MAPAASPSRCGRSAAPAWSRSSATRTLLTFLVLLYAVFLLSIAVASALLAVGLGGEGGHVLFAPSPAPAPPSPWRLAVASMRLRPREDAGRIGRAAADARRGHARRPARSCARPTSGCSAPRCGGRSTPPCSTACSTRSARRRAIAVVVLGYFVGMVANTIPLPGAVSGGMVGVLLAFGVEADLALASVLSYRALAIWLPAPVGLAALGSLRRTVARWGAEEAGEPAPGQARARRALGARAGAQRGMSYAPAPAAGGNGHRLALLGSGSLGAALFALVQAGVVAPPDLEGALADLSDTLGPWTYALVGGARVPGDRRVRRADRAGRDRGRARRRGRRRGRRRPAADAADRLERGRARRPGELLARPPARAPLPDRPRPAARGHRRRGSSASSGFFDRHGGKAILIGRFIGLVRAVAPFLAGSSGMRLRAFLPWSLLGTAAWATTFTLVGYAFHDSFTTAASHLTHAAFALAIVAAAVFAWRSHRRSRAASFARRPVSNRPALQGCCPGTGTSGVAMPQANSSAGTNLLGRRALITEHFLSAQARLAVGMAL